MTAEQLGLDGMPERLYPAYPTRLLTWLDCPRRYRMNYLQRPTPAKGPPWAHNSLGAAVHTALKRWYDREPAERTPTTAGDLVDESWLTDGFRDDAQSDRWRRRARAMVERYASGLDPDEEPLGVERTVAARTRRLAVSGRVDRIDERVGDDGAELAIVDYKTGRHVPDTDDVRGSLALALYAVAAERTLRRTCRTVELHHLPTSTVVTWRHSDSSLDRHVRRAEEIAVEAGAADDAWRRGLADRPDEWDDTFPSRPGSLCSWCDYLRHCPEGRAVAAPREPWSGLAED